MSFTGATTTSSTGTLEITFENPGATSYRLSFGTGTWDDIRLGTDSHTFTRTGTLNPNLPLITVT
jgi:hypothetical protein